MSNNAWNISCSKNMNCSISQFWRKCPKKNFAWAATYPIVRSQGHNIGDIRLLEGKTVDSSIDELYGASSKHYVAPLSHSISCQCMKLSNGSFKSIVEKIHNNLAIPDLVPHSVPSRCHHSSHFWMSSPIVFKQLWISTASTKLTKPRHFLNQKMNNKPVTHPCPKLPHVYVIKNADHHCPSCESVIRCTRMHLAMNTITCHKTTIY